MTTIDTTHTRDNYNIIQSSSQYTHRFTQSHGQTSTTHSTTHGQNATKPVSPLALTPQTQDLHGLDSHTTPNPHGFTQNPWPIHGFTKRLERKRSWVKEKNREVKTERKREESSREGERRAERERERQGSALPSQKPPLMVAVVSGAGGAWWRWENNDLGHGGLGPSREIRDERGREATGWEERKWEREREGGGWPNLREKEMKPYPVLLKSLLDRVSLTRVHLNSLIRKPNQTSFNPTKPNPQPI